MDKGLSLSEQNRPAMCITPQTDPNARTNGKILPERADVSGKRAAHDRPVFSITFGIRNTVQSPKGSKSDETRALRLTLYFMQGAIIHSDSATRTGPMAGLNCNTHSPLPACADLQPGTGQLLSLRNNNKRQSAMFKHSKLRQAGFILFGTILVLIVPNLTRLFG